MAPKFDQHKAKHTLIHVSLSLITILMCLTHIQRDRNWENIGKFWNSLILLFLFLGELTKIGLAKYFGRHERDSITSKSKKKEYIPIIKDLLGGLLFQGICTILYAFTCIILGAPVLTNYEQTFVISILLTLLTVSPTVLLIGVSGTLQVVFCEKADFLKKSEETAVNLYKYNAAGAIFGAWAGSVVVPLDWDRDWQNYPIPNVIGALLGCGLANIFVCTTVLFTTAKLYLNKKRM